MQDVDALLLQFARYANSLLQANACFDKLIGAEPKTQGIVPAGSRLNLADDGFGKAHPVFKAAHERIGSLI